MRSPAVGADSGADSADTASGSASTNSGRCTISKPGSGRITESSRRASCSPVTVKTSSAAAPAVMVGIAAITEAPKGGSGGCSAASDTGALLRSIGPPLPEGSAGDGSGKESPSLPVPSDASGSRAEPSATSVESARSDSDVSRETRSASSRASAPVSRRPETTSASSATSAPVSRETDCAPSARSAPVSRETVRSHICLSPETWSTSSRAGSSVSRETGHPRPTGLLRRVPPGHPRPPTVTSSLKPRTIMPPRPTMTRACPQDGRRVTRQRVEITVTTVGSGRPGTFAPGDGDMGDGQSIQCGPASPNLALGLLAFDGQNLAASADQWQAP